MVVVAVDRDRDRDRDRDDDNMVKTAEMVREVADNRNGW
jgi:hypothetical protein